MQRLLRCALAAAVCLSTVAAASATEVYLYDAKWGSYGTGDGQFGANFGLYLRGDRLYVADVSNSRVQILDLNGAYLDKFGTAGSGAGQFMAPRDLVFDSLQQYYVIDSDLDRFTIFGSTYVPLTARGGTGTEENKFDCPWRIALNDATGMLYIIDLYNKRVCQWSTGGVFQRVIGSFGTGDGQFSNPCALAVDGTTGDLYVGDNSARRIQVFNSSGVYQRQFTIGPASNPGYPDTLAVAPGGYLMVGDGGYGVVRKCTTSGTQVLQFGSFGSGDGQFLGFEDMAVDAAGRVFVADGQPATCRIQRFVRNCVPTSVAAVTIAPKPAHDADNLSAKVTAATDGDGDPLTYRYQWYYSTNNTTWNKSKAARVLPASYTAAGQYWKVKVRAYDGKSYGPWKLSAATRVVADAAPALAFTAASAAPETCLVTLSAAATVGGSLDNLAGRTVAALAPRVMPAGQTSLLLPAFSSSGARLPCGSYLLRLTARLPRGETSTQVLPVALR